MFASCVLSVVVLALLVGPAVSDTDEDCVTNPYLCSDDQCCVMMEGSEQGMCSDRQMENKMCEMEPETHPSNDNVFMNMCPCDKSLSCEDSQDGTGNSWCQLADDDAADDDYSDDPTD